ncbi:hypothetical protein QFC22_001145 [Naganishia vaughanmartiniae]|uniref:Uncharacterized protein n=1 Tax=Naganishia vaughanmartiniae TaxID=1424756 RepID=A0ACC2XK07_9TREE|nr:hypothetical protein QFC22_001145 [Naganishia vaughanmartiniae]
MYKGCHQLWPDAVGWEGSSAYPSYRVHVTGDPRAVDLVTRTRAHGRESSAPIHVDSLPLVDRYPIYNANAPGFTTTGPSRSPQQSNEGSKRFVSTGARPRSRKKRAVEDDKAPQGVARQIVLFGMLVRKAVDEKQVSADTIRMNAMAALEYEKKVEAKRVAAAPPAPVKVGLFAASRPALNQEHNTIVITDLHQLGIAGIVRLLVSTRSSAVFLTCHSGGENNAFETPGETGKASSSSDSAETPPVKKATGYGMFRKK